MLWLSATPSLAFEMGRRGNTGAGGAVVSSLSGNAGGTVKKKKGKNGKEADGHGSTGVEIVFEKETLGGKPNRGGSSSAPKSAPKSAGWIGKTPIVFLKEYCVKNDRKRPVYVPVLYPHPHPPRFSMLPPSQLSATLV